MKKTLIALFLVPFLSACDNGAVSDAKKALKSRLKDPESATFSEVKSNEDGTVCGKYNAKNSFGGYVGEKIFSYENGVITINEDEAAPDDEPNKIAWYDRKIAEIDKLIAICKKAGIK